MLGVDATSARVRWEACRPGTSLTVSFSPEGGGPGQSVEATETVATTSVTTKSADPNFPADYAGTWYMHEAALTDLLPATCYAYQLAADDTATGRFCTARNLGEPFRFMAIGDTNPALGSTAHVLDNVLPMNPDFVVHGGDIQYYSSLLETWAIWFQLMAPMLRQGALFAAIGNHESETPTEFTEYTERFFGNAGFDGTEQYYRFESGGVWFFCLDTEEPLDLSTPQGAWLASSLADAAGKPGYRFGIVYFHRPFVTCGDTGDDPTARQEFEPLFEQFKVPLVLQAHMHGYERFVFPGITYVTTAGGGGTIGDPNANLQRSYCGQRVASGGFFHATVIDVGGGGDAGGAELSAKVVDDQGAVRDTFQLNVQ